MRASHTITTPDGVVEISNDAVEQLVRRAVDSVAGVRLRRPRRGLDVDIVDGRARVSLELAVRYGVVVGDAARAVQQGVADALTGMCGVQVDSVDVSIEGLDD